MDAIKRWFTRQLANPQVALLGVLGLTAIIVIFFFGDMLAPFFAAVVIAYLLDGIVLRMQRRNLPRLLAVIIVFIGFLVGILLISFGLVPSVVNQLQSFVLQDVPKIVRAASTGMEAAQIRYDAFRKSNFPDLFSQVPGENPPNAVGDTNQLQTAISPKISETNAIPAMPSQPDEAITIRNSGARQAENTNDFLEIKRLTNTLEEEITNLGRTVVTTSINSFKNLVVWIVYLVLVPVLVFFLLKDKDRIIAWLINFLPPDRSLATQIWHDVNIQTSNYIRGKFWEIILVWSVTHVTFNLFGLNSALLLSLFVGLSVMVPYLGAAIMYIPISLVAFYQFGWDPMLFWVLLAYTIIQILDGNVLAPILLSEVTSLHPVAVIVAILIFGGLWGFWGVFFAIPLATLVNAIIKAWPKEFNHPAAETPSPEK
jgi:putative permease